MIRYEVLNDKELLAKLTALHGRGRHNVTAALRDAGMRIVSRARERAAPARDTGQLANSIGWEMASDDDLLVYATAPWAAYVEMGTRPHFPPLAPIRAWALRHGLPARAAWAICLAIARRGLPARPFLWPAVEEEKPFLRARLERIVDEGRYG